LKSPAGLIKLLQNHFKRVLFEKFVFVMVSKELNKMHSKIVGSLECQPDTLGTAAIEHEDRLIRPPHTLQKEMQPSNPHLRTRRKTVPTPLHRIFQLCIQSQEFFRVKCGTNARCQRIPVVVKKRDSSNVEQQSSTLTLP
jgi:hypothetical protein